MELGTQLSPRTRDYLNRLENLQRPLFQPVDFFKNNEAIKPTKQQLNLHKKRIITNRHSEAEFPQASGDRPDRRHGNRKRTSCYDRIQLMEAQEIVRNTPDRKLKRIPTIRRKTVRISTQYLSVPGKLR